MGLYLGRLIIGGVNCGLGLSFRGLILGRTYFQGSLLHCIRFYGKLRFNFILGSIFIVLVFFIIITIITEEKNKQKLHTG